MGYVLLIAGLALWTLAHGFRRLAPDRREAMGDAGKGLVALALAAAVALMVFGYKGAAFVDLWTPPEFMTHINNLLMVLAFWLVALSMIPGTISARIRHKQLTATKTWAVAHLLVNGDLASVLLFGGLLGWAVFQVILINRAEPGWTRPEGASVRNDLVALAAGLAAMAAVGFVHNWAGYWPYPG